jgi:hypothetical protein
MQVLVALVAFLGVAKPAYWRMVHSRSRYIGSSCSGRYSRSRGRLDAVRNCLWRSDRLAHVEPRVLPHVGPAVAPGRIGRVLVEQPFDQGGDAVAGRGADQQHVGPVRRGMCARARVRIDAVGPGGEVIGRRQAEGLQQRAVQRVGAGRVGLVDDEEVTDLHEAGLEHLHGVAGARRQHDADGVGDACDLDLALADADGLDNDDVAAQERHDAQHALHAEGKAPEVAAGGEGADEDEGVGGVAHHPDAVTEDGPAGERRGRVHGDDADAPVWLAAAQLEDHGVHEGGLAAAGRAGDAEHEAWPLPPLLGQGAVQLGQPVRRLLQQRHQPTRRAHACGAVAERGRLDEGVERWR